MVFRFSEPRSPRAILKHQALLYDSLKPRVPFAKVTVVHLESVPLIIHHPLPCRSRLCFVITPCTHAHGTEIAKVILLMLVEQNRSKQNIPFAWCVRLRTQGCRCSCEGGGSRAVQNARPQNVEPEHRGGSICLPTHLQGYAVTCHPLWWAVAECRRERSGHSNRSKEEATSILTLVQIGSAKSSTLWFQKKGALFPGVQGDTCT